MLRFKIPITFSYIVTVAMVRYIEYTLSRHDARNFLNLTKSDKTAVCENNEGSFSCVCGDGYERKSDRVEGLF